MTIFFVFLIALVAIYLLTRGNKKKKSIAKVTAHHPEPNVTEITIDLDEKELLIQLKGGGLRKTTRHQKKSAEDIADFYGTEEYSPNKKYCVVFCDGYYENEKYKNGQIALVQGHTLLFK